MNRDEYINLTSMCERELLVRQRGPIKINLELTARCNWSCPECPLPRMRRPKGDMETALAYRLIQEHTDNGGYYLDLFNFGEPLLYPYIIDVIKFAVNTAKVPVVHLNTNGSMITDGFAGQLVASGIHGINVSALPSTDGTWERAVYMLRTARDRAALKTPFIQVQSTGSKAITESDAEVAGADSLLSRQELDLTRGIMEMPKHHSPCPQPWRHLVVCWDGRVTVCCGDPELMLYVGDATKEKLKDIWHGPRVQSIREAEASGNPIYLCARCPDRERRP